MKSSKQWLQEWLVDEVSNAELLKQLPMLGHEIDSVESVAGAFTGVIVAEVVACEPHPNADRLRLCQVNTGHETLSIVCGGKNVRTGLKVALAKIGAVLPGDFKIKRGKIRGEESLGMLCSEVELGLAESSDGIFELPLDAPIGKDLRDYLRLEDVSIEVDLTPNRGDCLSVQGIAREIAAKNAIKLNPVTIIEQKPTCDATLSIEVQEPAACPLYAGRVIKNINNRIESPVWLKEKLRRSGLRSKSPVVDVTNYVLLELGQPMHGFDLEKLTQGIQVRYAKNNERLKLLNEEEVILKNNTLVIADHEKALAIAGVMGGYDSGCSNESSNIFLESALFSPDKISGIARQYGLHTDSSHRFERGVDPALPLKAMERATKLLLEISGGEAGPIVVCQSKNNLPQKQTIILNENKLQKILGMALEKAKVTALLQALSMQMTETKNGWEILPPAFRYDINQAEDLIEEVARFIGYDNIPMNHPQIAVTSLDLKEAERKGADWRQCLAARGYHEAMTYSFVDPKIQELICPQVKALTLSNPISADLAVMRTSLWAGLLQAVQYNQYRQQARIRLFELGKCFITHSQELQQIEMLAGVITGTHCPEQWTEKERKLDFYDIKGDVEALLDLTGKRHLFEFSAAKHPTLHPGQTSKLIYNEREVGWFGALHPMIQQKLGVSGAVFLFEIQQDVLKNAVLPKVKPISKFPSIRRDLALLVKNEVSGADLSKVVTNAAQSLLVDFSIFDVYQGDELPKGYKSIAIALTLQNNERTLVDDEVNDLMNQVIKALEQKIQAKLRV